MPPALAWIMNTERLLREVERRLVGLPESHRGEILDAVREEISRERRRVDPAPTVEAERERRLEAETLREVLEAINRHANLEETISEVLKQLARLLVFDSCCVALAGAEGFRIFAVRGFLEPSKAVGTLLSHGLADAIREDRWPIAVPDVLQDERFVPPDGCEKVRSWVGLPLMVEGQLLGLLTLHRHQVVPFDEEDVHRAKAVAFSAAAAIRKSQLHEHVRRYAALMERVVAVDQAVFQGRSPAAVAQVILDGALRIGGHMQGLLALFGREGARIAAVVGESLEAVRDRPAPPELTATGQTRLDRAAAGALGRALGVPLPPCEIEIFPLATEDAPLGVLALLAQGGDGPRDTLMEAYASRAATAYRHAVRSR
jgi:GAF domain-containing protein